MAIRDLGQLPNQRREPLLPDASPPPLTEPRDSYETAAWVNTASGLIRNVHGGKRGWDYRPHLIEQDISPTLRANKLRASDVTVRSPLRVEYPGIYKDPRQLAMEVDVAPQSPWLKMLFGVDRRDLYDMQSDQLPTPDDPRSFLTFETKTGEPGPSAESPLVTTRRNSNRMVDAMGYALDNRRDLVEGMVPWYESRPLMDVYDQIAYDPVESFGRFNVFTGTQSPGMPVVPEMQMGSAGLVLDNQGRGQDFVDYVSTARERRPGHVRDVMEHTPGRVGREGAKAALRFSETGAMDMATPKVPLYIASWNTPGWMPYNRAWPVMDAHNVRSIGLPDVRTRNKGLGHSASMNELMGVGPWWEKNVAGPLGLDSVQSQALAWGLYGPQTGVETAVGASKLELLADNIGRQARMMGVDPMWLRDEVLMGRQPLRAIQFMGGK